MKPTLGEQGRLIHLRGLQVVYAELRRKRFCRCLYAVQSPLREDAKSHNGNICRSPMAEFVLKDMVEKMGLKDKFHIESAATSREALGEPVHTGTRKILAEHGISCDGKYAVQLKASDYDKYDFIIAMDSYNIENIKYIIPEDPESKISKLLYFTDEPGDISDPWYTGDFKRTWQDITKGCKGFLDFLSQADYI